LFQGSPLLCARKMVYSEIINILEKRSALIRDSHIVYTSGRHGCAYVNKDAIYPDTHAVSSLCRILASHFTGLQPTVVAAPAIGGVILAQWLAHHLSEGMRSTVLAVYAEKNLNEGFDFRRGYDKIIEGARVLIAEDILTTGGSVSAVVRAVRSCGGEVVGVGALCNRGAVTAAHIGFPPELYSLIEIPLESWTAEECPLCAQGVPINTEVGKGRDFIAQRLNGNSGY